MRQLVETRRGRCCGDKKPPAVRPYCLLWIWMCWAGVAASLAGTVRGTVEGPRGLIPGAEVVLLQQGRSLQTASTGPDGRFVLGEIPAGTYQLQVVSLPYSPVVQGFEVSGSGQEIELRVELSTLNQSITVTAARLPMPITASVSDAKLVTAADLREMPYQALDDGLRSLPEFSLFRRASSLVAHPTTQGVSLRGIGPSGVSRSLVLADGIPLNDAFGGWVYWDRIPLLSLQQVEVANGGGSSLYGNYALGGVVQVLKRSPRPATLEFLGQAGSRGSWNGDVYGSHRAGPVGFSVAGSFFDFDGYPLVTSSQRGPVDIAAFSRHQAARFQTEWAPRNTSWTGSLEGGFLHERRGNGTPQQNNDTDAFDFAAAVQGSLGSHDRIEARSFFRRNIFRSSYTAVAADRRSERLTTLQHVPSTDGGASLLWFHERQRHSFVAGADFWIVRGQSTDNVFAGTPPAFTRIRLGGGEQATSGFFGEAILSLSSQATVVLGGRVDVWKNFDGFQGNFLPANRLVAPVPAAAEAEFSPRLGFAYHIASPVTLYASLNRAFRAPTLNELYRVFVVGNVTTNGNIDLKPEHNTGGEIGARYRIGDALAASVSWFGNLLDNPVSNVTLQTTPTTIIRQRRNLGSVRILGLQTSLDWKPAPRAELELLYLWDRSRVTEFAADPALVDKLLPQVPEHRLTAKAAVSLPQEFRFVLTGRFVDQQFDDDLNQVVLPSFLSWDAQVSRSLGKRARLFVAFENLTGARIVVNRSPVELLGTPFQARGGIYFGIGGQ